MEKRLEEMMEQFLQRRSKDSAMAECYFQILAMLYARLVADVPVLGQIRSTQRMLNQAILDRNSGLGQWLRQQLGQLEDR
jgi:hypothetical protein